MQPEVKPPSIKELDRALMIVRRLPMKLLGVLALGALALALFGSIGLICALVAIIAVMWLDGREIGKALHDRSLLFLPPLAILSAPGIIAQHAHAAGMEWTGFFGPLRPARCK